MCKRILANKLGEILVQRGVMVPAQVEAALDVQKVHRTHRLSGRLFVELGFAREEQVAEAFAAQYEVPCISLEQFDIDAELAQLVPPWLAHKYSLVPVERIGNSLSVAMAYPTDDAAIRVLEELTHCHVVIFFAVPSEVNRRIEALYFGKLDIVDEPGDDRLFPYIPKK